VSDVRLLGVEDSSIFQYARTNNFDAIITNDEDYYWLSLLNGFPPKIIWLRTGNMTTDNITAILTEKHKDIEDFLNDANEICLEIK
jgi:predicted nuclease of predicted toxin-antitoxin system